MIHDLLVRWVVTGLFALAAVECGLPILIRRRPWTTVVGHSFHLAMAVAMAAMAWPWSTRLPTTGPAVFFLLATLWFATMAVVAAPTRAPRVLYGYHGLMMLATAWMYASMNGHLGPIGSSTRVAMSMPGMAMAGANTQASSGPPAWLSAVNWLGTITFAAAAVWWMCGYLIGLRHTSPRFRAPGYLGEATMAGGMAILFLATLFDI